MLNLPDIGDKWGRWTLLAAPLGWQTWRCSCGVERTIREGFYAAGRLSVMCRDCRIKFESERLTRLFNADRVGLKR